MKPVYQALAAGSIVGGVLGGLVNRSGFSLLWAILGGPFFLLAAFLAGRYFYNAEKKAKSRALTPEMRGVFDRMLKRKTSNEKKLVESNEPLDISLEGSMAFLADQQIQSKARGEVLETMLIPHIRIKLDILIKSYQKDRARLIEMLKATDASPNEKKVKIQKIQQELEDLIFALKRESSGSIVEMFEKANRERTTEFAELEREVRAENKSYSIVDPINKVPQKSEHSTASLSNSNLSTPMTGIVVLPMIFATIIEEDNFSALEKMVAPGGHGLIDGGKWVVILRNLGNWNAPVYKSWPSDARFMAIWDMKEEGKKALSAYFDHKLFHDLIQVLLKPFLEGKGKDHKKAHDIMNISLNCPKTLHYTVRSAVIKISGWSDASERTIIFDSVAEVISGTYEDLIAGSTDIAMTFAFSSGDKFSPEVFMQRYTSGLKMDLQRRGMGNVIVEGFWLDHEGKTIPIGDLGKGV